MQIKRKESWDNLKVIIRMYIKGLSINSTVMNMEKILRI